MSDSDAATTIPFPPVGLMARMGIAILEVGAERAVGTMPVAGNTQPYGLLHGGASAVLAETLGSYAAAAHAQTLSPDGIAVGVDLNITHLRGVRDGIVTGTATAIHLGRTIAAYQVDLVDETGTMTATARLTCAVKTRR